MRLSADGECAALRDKANYIRLFTAPISSLHPNHLLYRGRLLVLGVLRDGFDCAGSGGTRSHSLSQGVALRIQLCRVSWDKEPSPVPYSNCRYYPAITIVWKIQRQQITITPSCQLIRFISHNSLAIYPHIVMTVKKKWQ